MKKFFYIPLAIVFIASCTNSQADNSIKKNADAAENFIYLVLNAPVEAKKFMDADFVFGYMR